MKKSCGFISKENFYFMRDREIQILFIIFVKFWEGIVIYSNLAMNESALGQKKKKFSFSLFLFSCRTRYYVVVK